jgi:hypothetical protein
MYIFHYNFDIVISLAFQQSKIGCSDLFLFNFIKFFFQNVFNCLWALMDETTDWCSKWFFNKSNFIFIVWPCSRERKQEWYCLLVPKLRVRYCLQVKNKLKQKFLFDPYFKVKKVVGKEISWKRKRCVKLFLLRWGDTLSFRK